MIGSGKLAVTMLGSIVLHRQRIRSALRLPWWVELLHPSFSRFWCIRQFMRCGESGRSNPLRRNWRKKQLRSKVLVKASPTVFARCRPKAHKIALGGARLPPRRPRPRKPWPSAPARKRSFEASILLGSLSITLPVHSGRTVFPSPAPH